MQERAGNGTDILLEQINCNVSPSNYYVAGEDALPAVLNLPVRLIAFYLPQFHPIPENDFWWGKGFTEWTNVTRALPRFVGHYQPRLPGDLGFYDLRVPDVLRRQAALAKKYGIGGFCFYYYWFDGMRLLDGPLSKLLSETDIDLPFCICWANENWTRSWDGLNEHVLMEQKYSPDDDLAFARAIEPVIRDRRYITVSGRPLVIVYRPSLLPSAIATARRWRTYFVRAGIADPYLAIVQSFGDEDPRPYGFDAAIEFPPHKLGFGTTRIDSNLKRFDTKYQGAVYDYEEMARRAASTPPPSYTLFRGVCPSWDNEPRRPGRGHVFAHSSPAKYGRWLGSACREALAAAAPDERLVFVNAWNEWAEGAYLEPDRHYGHAYLAATARVLSSMGEPSVGEYVRTPGPGVDQRVSVPNVSALAGAGDALMSKASAAASWRVTYLRAPRDVDPASLALPTNSKPVVSVIIPTYGQTKFTLRCLWSIASSAAAIPIETILVDDAASDPDVQVLESVRGIRFIRNQHNLGFLRTCNTAATYAVGRYLIFLNNDTEVQPGAIDALASLMEARPEVGMAGSKLIYPDGRLQEAGGIVWDDGSALNVGRDSDATSPEYNYVRECDYCSGAAIIVRRALFVELGGFDEYFAPAYYEDTDLAFRIRARGQTVLYEPRSVVIHHEGASHGTDVEVGIKMHQEINKHRMRERWAEVLRRDHFPRDTQLLRARDRARYRQVLLVADQWVPQPDKDAGSRSTLAILTMLVDAGLVVKFWPHNRTYSGPYTTALEAIGIEVVDERWPGELSDWLRVYGNDLDHVMLMRPNIAIQLVHDVLNGTAAAISYYGHDLHSVRLDRQAILSDDQALKAEAAKLEQLERRIWQLCDVALYPSHVETELARAMEPGADVHTIVPFCFENLVTRSAPPSGAVILFVGGFAFEPNVDAATWLAHDILPRVHAERPDARLVLAGSHPGKTICALAGTAIEVTGYLTDDELAKRYAASRVAVAPLRFGAGVKGKVAEALSQGLPLVTTPIGAEGIPGIEAIVPIREDAAGIADAILLLLSDDAVWMTQSAAETAYAEKHFSRAAMRASLLDALNAAEVAHSSDTQRETPKETEVRVFRPPGHFYSPIVNPTDALEFACFQRNSEEVTFPDIALNRTSMRQLWDTLLPILQSTPFPERKSHGFRYFFQNDNYSYGDAAMLRALILHLAPKRIFEIGSGYSTACMMDTIDRSPNLSTKLTCIDPHAELLLSLLQSYDKSRVVIIESPVQRIPLSTFKNMEKNDILFIDSTHVLKTGSDVSYELGRILPELNDGVIVHFHDIFYPFEYPYSWIIEENRSWNELYAVRAFLSYNSAWDVLFFNDMFGLLEGPHISATWPTFLRNSGGGLWLQRKTTSR